MKRVLLPLMLLLLLLTACGGAQVQVAVSSPVTGATVNTTFTVTASATSTHPITGWHVYADNKDVFGASNVAKIAAKLSLTAGKHALIVRAWDSSGAYNSKLLSVTVVPPTPTPSPTPVPTPSPTPTPVPPTPTPTPFTVLDHVEENNWLTCGNCGNSGATGPTAAYFVTLGIADPSEDGNATQFSITPPSPYANGYFYQRHTPISTQIAALVYEFDLYLPTDFADTPQAIEFECQQIVGGWVYNFSWQALYTANEWRIFDYGLKRWDSTGIKLTRFTPGTWHHIVAEYHNDTVNHLVIHDALTVDGVRVPVNIMHNAFNSGSTNNQFTNAVQLDTNAKAQPYFVFIDGMKISYR